MVKKVVFDTFLELLMNSCILYKLTVEHPKTRLEFIKDVIDSLASPLIIKKLKQSVLLVIKVLQIYLRKKKMNA